MIGLVRPTQGEVLFDGHNLAKLSDQRTDPPADSLRLRVSAGGAVRQHDGGPERRLSAAPAHRQRRRAEIRRDRARPAGRSRPAGKRDRTRNRPSCPAACGSASAWPGPWPWIPRSMLYDEPTTGLDPIMSDVINELILRTRATLSGDQRRRDARHAHGAQGGRPGRDALSAAAAESRTSRRSSSTAAPAELERSRRSARDAIRPRRGGRTADGNGRTNGWACRKYLIALRPAARLCGLALRLRFRHFPSRQIRHNDTFRNAPRRRRKTAGRRSDGRTDHAVSRRGGGAGGRR